MGWRSCSNAGKAQRVQWARQAVGRTQIQVIISPKFFFPQCQTASEGIGMQQFCTLPLTAGFASSRVHPCSLSAAAVAWFSVMINGKIELKQIIRMPSAITHSFSLKPVWHPAPSISHLQGEKGQENVPARTRSSFSGLEMNTTHCHHSSQCVFCIHICIPLYILLNQPSTENHAKQLVQIHLWINFGPKALIYSNGT